MKKVLLWIMFLSLVLHANDGAYTLSGNQLIPINESNISIKKEVLTITRIDDEEGILDVKVEYTFFNPSKSKTIVVGFEAAEPDGDVTTEPVNGGHPYMKSFSVEMNGKNIAYKINSNVAKANIGYVYYFKAPFKKGINHITHHYRYEPSGGVMTHYEIDYILSAASRWKGNVIEDFILIIDVGDFADFVISKDFFKSGDEWQVDGHTKESVFNWAYVREDEKPTPATQFYVKKSPIVFKKKNFKIDGDLSLVSWRYKEDNAYYFEEFNYKKVKLFFDGNTYFNDNFPKDRVSFKIYKNFPYAQRGYIFKDKEIQKYYEGLSWYKKEPNYKPTKPFINEKLNVIALNILKNLSYAKRGYIFKSYDLRSFFSVQSWYIENKNYKSSFLALPKNEQEWINKIKALKKSDNIDFYDLMDEYDTMYDNCLHKHEKKKVDDFMKRLILMDKKQIRSRFSKKDISRIEEDLIDDIFLEITKETLANYAKGYSDEEDTFQIELHEDEENKGCYEYFYSHGFEGGDDEYGFMIGIGKENGAFKIVRLSMAG